MKRLIIYDLDGTLVDTLEDIARATNHMLTQLRAEPLPLEDIRKLIGRGLPDLVRGSLKTDDEERLVRGIQIYRAYYTHHLLDHSRLYSGAEAILEHFRRRRQAVVTNKPDPYSREILEALGVADYFFEIVTGSSFHPKKPHPAAVLALMRCEEVSPEETMLVGDSPIDVQTGRSAGVFTVCLTHGLASRDELASADPDLMAASFEELLGLAEARGW